MKRLQKIIWLLLLVLLCGCAAQPLPDIPPESLPETVSKPVQKVHQEACQKPKPVPAERVIEEPEVEYALIPAEPVWLLGRLTETWSAGEMQWAERGSVLEAIAPLRLSDAEALLDGLPSVSYLQQDYVPLADVEQTFGLEWGQEPDGLRYLAKRKTVGEIPDGYNVPILMYHAVGDDIWGYSDLFVSTANMEAQLKWLQENGYETIWFSDLAHVEDYEKPVILTFDDGYDDNYTVLYPLLEQYQAKATIFVIGNAMGSAHKMTREQVYELAASGLVSIQSHTYTHGNLSAMDEETLRLEMERSNAALAAATGQIPYVLCYPEGTGMDRYQVPRSYISRRTAIYDFNWYVGQAGKAR